MSTARMNFLLTQLRTWQLREALYLGAWSFARWLALILLTLSWACLLDWWIDRYQETPFALRLSLTLGQLILYTLAGFYLLRKLAIPSLDSLASRAETAFPELGHRLVTAIQLNRPGARTAGMSPTLIAALTQEAIAISAEKNYLALADRSKLERALQLLIPLLLVAGAFAAFRPSLVSALLARQLLANVPIPRSVNVAHASRDIWPSGDEVELRFLVTGRVHEHSSGSAILTFADQPSITLPLAFREWMDEKTALFTGTVPPLSVPFRVIGRVGDGRTPEQLNIQFVPRPSVTDLQAWLQLPLYVDPEGRRRYERFQPQGEVFALQDSQIRLEVQISKPIVRAEIVLLRRDPKGQESDGERLPMSLSEDRQLASVIFPVPSEPSGYRVELYDEYGFSNWNPPRRGITLLPDEPPQVELLEEVLKDPREEGPLEDFEVNRMPLALGGQVQIGYRARSPLGLSRAFIVYRVNEGPWTPLPLRRTVADLAEVGPFIPELGVFLNSGIFGQVEFYWLPPEDPETAPPGLEAGGRYNFQTAALKKTLDDGRSVPLEVGDRVEFQVVVYDRNPAPAEAPEPPPPESETRPNQFRRPGRSESRIKMVVTQAQLQAWLEERDQSRERLRELEAKQKGIFTRETR